MKDGRTDITLPQMVASIIRGPRLFAVFRPKIFHPKNRDEAVLYYLVYLVLHYTFCIRPSNNLIIYNGEQKT